MRGLHISNFTGQAMSSLQCWASYVSGPTVDTWAHWDSQRTPTRKGVPWPSQRTQSPTKAGKDFSQGTLNTEEPDDGA